jgi:hypothetical protein
VVYAAGWLRASAMGMHPAGEGGRRFKSCLPLHGSAHQTPEQIVEGVLQEETDAVGLSFREATLSAGAVRTAYAATL